MNFFSIASPPSPDGHDTKDFLFAYGSIINDYSRLATLGKVKEIETSCKGNYQSAGWLEGDEAAGALLSPDFGYKRSWCYRFSNRYFTLLSFSLYCHSHYTHSFSLSPPFGTIGRQQGSLLWDSFQRNQMSCQMPFLVLYFLLHWRR